MDWKKIYRGDINGEPAFLTLKKAMLELLKGYPAFHYYGIFESYFGGIPGDSIVKILEDDGFIDVKREKDKQPQYRLTSKGIDLAISMINLDYSEETSRYNKNMHRFTIWIITLTIITAIVGIIQIAPKIIEIIGKLT
jgi:hypothetical protein